MAEHMTCQEFVELVTAYLDDALDPDTRSRFEEHLVLCPGCVTYVDQFKETIDRVGSSDDAPALSSDTEASLMNAFRTWHK
jgi:anti-sigma factor RsiW